MNLLTVDFPRPRGTPPPFPLSRCLQAVISFSSSLGVCFFYSPALSGYLNFLESPTCLVATCCKHFFPPLLQELILSRCSLSFFSPPSLFLFYFLSARGSSVFSHFAYDSCPVPPPPATLCARLSVLRYPHVPKSGCLPPKSFPSQFPPISVSFSGPIRYVSF